MIPIVILAAFIVLAYVSFHRKSVALKFITFACAIGYMGFSKSYLISMETEVTQGGQHIGVYAFGDAQRWRNHWSAYTFVKAQNRFEGRYILTSKPIY